MADDDEVPSKSRNGDDTSTAIPTPDPAQTEEEEKEEASHTERSDPPKERLLGSQAAMDEHEKDSQHAMTLNVAYESLELVRQANLQWEFGDGVDVDGCIPCLREKGARPTWRRRPKAAPCLTCGSTVCSQHRSRDFGKQNIIVCSECSRLFDIEFLVQSIIKRNDDQKEQGYSRQQNDEESKKKINYILEVYDRALLILKYSLPFIEEIAVALEKNTSRHNRIGLGSSATGVVSGAMGVAAAATIWTPVGPPLLIASILFGGSATAAAAGSEAVNYKSEPNKMADRILVLHAIVHSISNLPAIVDTGAEVDGGSTRPLSNSDTSSLHWTRATMNGLKPLTGGALSAISIVTEAREMKTTIKKMRNGNPCEKAEMLRSIQESADRLPDTNVLAIQLEIIKNRWGPIFASNQLATCHGGIESSCGDPDCP